MAKQNETNNNVPKLVQIKLEKYEDFNSIITTSTERSNALELKISEFFGSTFADFEGCKIMPVGDKLKCKIYFKPAISKGEGIYAVKVRGEDLATKGRFKLSDVVNTVNKLSKSKQYELEDLAKEILAEFLIISDATIVDRYNEELDKVVKVRLPRNWDPYTEEITDVNTVNRFQNPYFAVVLDLVPIVAKLYGKKDQAELDTFAGTGALPKDRYQYAVNVVKVLNPTMLQYILEIRRIDIKEMDKLSQSIGYGMIQGNIIMTRRS